MSNINENLELRIRPRESATVSISIPRDTLESLEKVAIQQEMSLAALLRFYIGRCLRQDLSQMFAHQVLDSTAKVLARHHHSEAEVAQILKEIQLETK
ncbi:MAG: hypothetical protein AAFW84_28210 [Cyanobacteria bacterium J06635_15]